MQHPDITKKIGLREQAERRERWSDFFEVSSNTAIGFTYNWFSIIVLLWLANTNHSIGDPLMFWLRGFLDDWYVLVFISWLSALKDPAIFSTVAGINATGFHFLRCWVLRRIYRRWGLRLVDLLLFWR